MRLRWCCPRIASYNVYRIYYAVPRPFSSPPLFVTQMKNRWSISSPLLQSNRTRIHSDSLGFARVWSVARERETLATRRIFDTENTVVNTVFIPFYIHPPPRQYIYSSSHHGNPPWNNLTPKQYVVNFFKCRSVLSLSLSTYHSAQWTKTKLSFVEFRVIPGQSRAQ